jgi:DNA-binding NtrC family response regulator
VATTIARILIIDDELGSVAPDKRRQFCEGLRLTEHGLAAGLPTEIPKGCLALATFVSGQVTRKGWTTNDLDQALDAISAGWPFPDGGRWAAIFIDMNFSCGKDREQNELFGRTILHAVQDRRVASAEQSAPAFERLPVVMLSSDPPAKVERQTDDRNTNISFLEKWGGGPAEEAARARREFGHLLFKEALIEDGALRYVREDGTVLSAERKHPIMGSSLEILETLRNARKILAKPRNARILVMGERGSGKELLVEYLHDHRRIARIYGGSSRERPQRNAGRQGPDELMVVHLKENPADLFAPALKGHEEAAFTGARGERKGPIELSGTGTVHLDEIGNLPVQDLQILLRLVESDTFTRVGGTTERPINCQFIATTNKDVAAMLARQEFPSDLYDRFDKLTMPPLRERRGDIRVLFEAFLTREVENLGCRPKQVDDEVWERAEREQWNGNVRQLKTVVETIVSEREYSAWIKAADFERVWARTGDVVRTSWQGGLKELVEAIGNFEVDAGTELSRSWAELERAQLRLWKSLVAEAMRRNGANHPRGRVDKTAVVRLLTGQDQSPSEADRWLGKHLGLWPSVFGPEMPESEFPAALYELLAPVNKQKAVKKSQRT